MSAGLNDTSEFFKSYWMIETKIIISSDLRIQRKYLRQICNSGQSRDLIEVRFLCFT